MTMDIIQYGPNPCNPYPLKDYKRLCFLKNIIKNPNIIVGDYTYYDDFENPDNFEKNILYHFDFIGDKLIIGKLLINICRNKIGHMHIFNVVRLQPMSTGLYLEIELISKILTIAKQLT